MEPEARIVLAFDLDNMYVACERLRNPSLVGKPVGVQQKGLLATASYEARALGVDKLCSLWEAKKRCPSLILVNGEDLTLYRYYSRRVFLLVRSVLGDCPVEKLGMDELFCDVTNLVKEHLQETRDISPDPRGRWFALARAESGALTDYKGFWYNPSSECPGHTIPQYDPTVSDNATLPESILAASHLANHIRHLVLTQIGLGSSAGIAYDKTIAKLVGNMHKPHQQTTLVVSPTASEEYSTVVQTLLDPLNPHKLMGFGSKALHTLRDYISTTKYPITSPSTKEDDRDELALTVGLLRSKMTAALFGSLLGAQNGQKIWDLLEGRDNEPVKMSPEFPLTISVEDSFDQQRGTLDWSGVLTEIETLANSLLRRLEIELVDGGELETLGREAVKPDRRRKWQRYPSQIRLTIRGGHSRQIAYNANRESRSAPLPVPVFDLDIPRTERAQGLIRQPLAGLAKQILDKGGEPVEKYEFSIINIAVTNLQTTTPTKAINAFFAASPWDKQENKRIRHSHEAKEPASSNGSKRRRRTLPPDIDINMIKELPADIRDEVVREYGIIEFEEPPSKIIKRDVTEHTLELADDVNQASATPESNTVADGKKLSSVLESMSDDGCWTSDDDDKKAMTPCTLCGAVIFDWSMAAHMTYHSGS
ncbi:DNA/RNA polymerase [Dacryopinax primogenitus]|uniref:DNA/RNA polymerase n=1 Tax=Dacryopinax primogenitus (strain DJM 731) TaxID=1858805 RepID=M5FQP2_DACPD|nr:DNA/RNA polymerase [Dacryopinax primogenitus]EJT97868.1 DNA/RNA polymerase [Dacryopinax primogenitus]